MLSLLRKLLRGLGKVAVAFVAAVLVLFIVLFAGGVLLSLLAPGNYGMAAAFGYALLVFLAALVLFVQTLRRKETVLDAVDGAGFVPGVCAGTVAGLVVVVAMAVYGEDPSSLGALKVMVVSSLLGAALLS